MPKPKHTPKSRRRAGKREALVDPALVADLVEVLRRADPKALNAWLDTKLPRGMDAGLAFAKRMLARCRKGSGLEHFRGVFQLMRDQYQSELDRVNALHARAATDPVGTLASLVAWLEEEGLIPEDWETREGDDTCVTRWHHEACERMRVALEFEKRGETARYREALRSSLEATRICMDRVLTLPPANRDELAAGIANELATVERLCAEEFGE